jgi:hypothetical protein
LYLEPSEETAEDPTQDYPLCRFYDIRTNETFERQMTIEMFEKLLEYNPQLQKIEIIPKLEKTTEENQTLNVSSWVHQV